MADLISLEDSLKELKKLPMAKYSLLPIKAEFDEFEKRLKELKKPYWIKINSGEHKTKQGGVEKAESLEDLKIKHGKLKKKFPNEKFVVQESIEGEEIILGLKKDKTFGKVLLIGSGGNLAETIGDTEFRILPVKKREINKTLKNLKTYKILKKNKCNIKKLTKFIEKFSNLAMKSEWEIADLNPVIVNKKEAKLVDARIVI